MKNMIYKKRINWESVCSMFAFVAMMSSFLLMSTGNLIAVIIDITLISIVGLAILLCFFGAWSYQLTLSDTCITDKSILGKKTAYNWNELKQIHVSMDRDLICLSGDNIQLVLKGMARRDQLLADLCERLGYDKLMIGIIDK